MFKPHKTWLAKINWPTNIILLKMWNWPPWNTHMPKSTLAYSASTSPSISASRLLGITLPIANLPFAGYNPAGAALSWAQPAPRWEQDQELLPGSSSHFPVRSPLLTHKFASSGSWQERKSRENICSSVYWFGSELCVLVKNAWGGLTCLNSVSVFQVQLSVLVWFSLSQLQPPLFN